MTYYSENKKEILLKLKLKRSSMNYKEKDIIRRYNRNYYLKTKHKRLNITPSIPIEIKKETIVLNFN